MAVVLGAALLSSWDVASAAESGASEAPAADFETPLFSIESPIGPIEYRAGRGLRFGDTGLVIGGFTTLEFDQSEGRTGEFEIDAVNLLILLEPIPRLAFFSELEIGDLLSIDTASGAVESSTRLEIERLYAEWRFDDALKTRLGKFQTPIGRWNLVPSEPFVWTAIEPVGVELAFDEYQTGAALHGSLYPDPYSLDYWLYGQATRQLHPEQEPEPSEHGVGGRLVLGRDLAGWSVGGSFLATEIDRSWSFLGGLDAQWQGARFELTTEALIQGGNHPARQLRNVYVQGVFELCRGFHAVARYEYVDARGRDSDANLGDVGFAWIPLHFVHLKASYRFADQQTEAVRRGVSASVSLVF